MKKFQNVYDFHHGASIPWIFYAFIIPVVVGVCIFIYNWFHGDREGVKMGIPKRTYGMIFGTCFAGFGLLALTTMASTFISKYYNEKDYFNNGKYKIVEGRVENFHPMPEAGHDTEHFDVNSVHFDYSSFDLGDLGYNDTQVNGGIMKQGLYVRLTYITANDRNAILKIDTLLK